MVAAIASTIDPHPLAGGAGEFREQGWGDRLSRALQRGGRALGIDPRLIPSNHQAANTFLHHDPGAEIGDFNPRRYRPV